MALRAELVRGYRATLAGLLPRGLAWSRAEESNLQRLLQAYAVELATVDERVAKLREEGDPRTALELLPEWEKLLGLPSPCTGPIEDLASRRHAVEAKLTREASASLEFLEEFAGRLGYLVDVVEFRSARMGSAGAGSALSNVQVGARMGSSGAGDRLENATGWAHTWAVRSNGGTTTYARMGSSGAGDRLRLIGNALLECSLREINPAHATLLFFYFLAIDPAPAALELDAPAPSTS